MQPTQAIPNPNCVRNRGNHLEPALACGLDEECEAVGVGRLVDRDDHCHWYRHPEKKGLQRHRVPAPHQRVAAPTDSGVVDAAAAAATVVAVAAVTVVITIGGGHGPPPLPPDVGPLDPIES